MFKGSMVALVTPFRDGQVDEKSLRELVEWQITSGTDVLTPCGTTGESATLSHEEHDRVIRIVVEQAKRRVKVLAGAGSNATDEAVRLTKEAKKSGADGVLSITPYYNKPTQEGLYQHFKAIAASTDIPIILYNVPGRTSVNMLPETVARCAKIDNIVGIKEASGNLVQVLEILKECGSNFDVISGEDALNFPIMACGGTGSISVTANIVPHEMAAMCDSFFAGDHEKARGLHEKLLPLHEAMFFETNPIPVKTALSLMGKCSAEMRLPLCPMGETNLGRLKKVLKEHKIL
ncbi:MAG: 4-hydroxy-tetrahydrodipicolinate synthase [Deltaproteobacteria bacterium]|nr:4-hydroxy-tetrahydrodipicolinate synthase [Deltaproteobacteria bacterium]